MRYVIIAIVAVVVIILTVGSIQKHTLCNDALETRREVIVKLPALLNPSNDTARAYIEALDNRVRSYCK